MTPISLQPPSELLLLWVIYGDTNGERERILIPFGEPRGLGVRYFHFVLFHCGKFIGI